MRHPEFFLLIFLLPLFSACQSDVAPQLSEIEFVRILENAAEEDSLPSDAIETFSSDESLFLAMKAAKKGFISTAERLAAHSYENAEGLFKIRAGRLMVDLKIGKKEYRNAEFMASKAAAEFPNEYFFKRAVCEAEYLQRKDRQLIDTINTLKGFSEAEADYELYLYEAVAAYRLRFDDWQRYWIDMIHIIPASDIMPRAFVFLESNEEDIDEVFGEFSSLAAGKYLYALKKYSDSAESYTEYLEEAVHTAAADRLTDVVVSDIESAFLSSGDRIEGARLLEKTAGTITRGNDCLFAAARMFRRAGLYRDADRCMEAVLEDEGFNRAEDRVLWYSLDLKLRTNLSAAIEAVELYSDLWDSPDYFSDVLDNLITALAMRRRWDDIRQLALILDASGPGDIFDRCRYITERAAEEDLTGPVSFSVPYRDLYYRILSGDELEEFKVPESGDYTADEAELFIDGLLRYSIDGVLEEAGKYSDRLSESFLAETAGRIAAAGEPLDSIRLMYLYPAALGPIGSRALYPDLYRKKIEASAAANEIPVQLLYAIVWKESGFEKEIVSRSGAVGLSQLMPSTAADVAQRTDTIITDLTDPELNLFLGSWYFKWLTTYTGTIANSVLSYNGGPGRVKRWLEGYSDLPPELFYEVIPVAETHDYGKKVITAAVLYGMFYYNIDAKQTLELFFS